MLITAEFITATVLAKVRAERGASLVEYALLVTLIAVVCIAAVASLGKKVKSNFNSVATSI